MVKKYKSGPVVQDVRRDVLNLFINTSLLHFARKKMW